jgi:MFS family permease
MKKQDTTTTTIESTEENIFEKHNTPIEIELEEEEDEVIDEKVELIPKQHQQQQQEEVIPDIPWKQLSIVFMIFVIDVFSFTTLAPYLAALVRDLNLVPENDTRRVGYYASIIGSSYYIAQFMSASFWGVMSDKYGRRIVLLIGILGGCITSFLFGFSKNLYWALSTRVLFGLVNGNLGTHKTYISEITHKSHHPKVFSYISLTFSAGTVLGPLVGGLLSSPIEQYPWMLSYLPLSITSSLAYYPFLLPNLVVSGIQLIAFVMAYEFLQESNVKVIEQQQQSTQGKVIELLDLKNTTAVDTASKPVMKGRNELYEIGAPLITIVLYSLIGFNNIVFAECAPLFMVLNKENGGLGFKQRQIGITGSITGVLLCLFQLFVCHKIMTRLGLLKAFRWCSLLLVLLLPLYPFLNNFVNSPAMLWISLVVLNFVRFAAVQTNFAACNVMMNNSVLPQNRGKLNGVAQSAVSLARALAPMLGIVFALTVSYSMFPFNIYFTYLIMSIVHGLCAALTIPLTTEINAPKVMNKNSVP